MTNEAEQLRREYYKKYREENKERIDNNHKSWRQKNKEKLKQYNENYWNKKANELKIKSNDYRKQQLIYNLYLVKEQHNPIYILFGSSSSSI